MGFMGTVMCGLSESIALASKSDGITSEELVEVLMCGALASPIVNAKGNSINKQNFAVNFPLRIFRKYIKMVKSLRYCLKIYKYSRASAERYEAGIGLGYK